MGDLIHGFFLIIVLTGLYGLYRLITRKAPERRSFSGFVSLFIVAGGIFGLATTCFDKQFQESYPVIFGLTLLLFMTQAIAACLYSKMPKAMLPVLLFTFLLQVPIVHSNRLFYRSQTLVSFNIDNYPGKRFDIEPGSYVSYTYRLPNDFSLGINLIPVLTAIVFLRDQKHRKGNKAAADKELT